MANQSAISPPAGAETTVASEGARRHRIDLLRHRNFFFLLSLIIIVPGMISMITQGFSLGVDFVGGNQATIYFQQPTSLARVQEAVSALQGNSATVQETTGGAGAGGFVITTPTLTPTQQSAFEQQLAARVGAIDQGRSSYSQVGASVAQNAVRNAFAAVLLASVLILGYLAFRFRKVPGGWRSGLQFGGTALIKLLHDVFVLTGIYSILGRVLNLPIGQINSLFITALLTVVGFSIHDTIVVFDRIRENMLVTRGLTFDQITNLSLMQTLNRSIITSFTVVIVLLGLLVFGGATIQGFTLAFLIGIVSGTFSSIFNAAPLLVVWRHLQPVR